MVARTERSPGFGPPLAFPVAQWRHERSDAPVTVAGPRRRHTGFRASPFADLTSAASLPAARLPGKGGLELRLEPLPPLEIPGPLLRGRLRFPALIPGVEQRDLADQPVG